MMKCPVCGSIMSRKVGGIDVCSTEEYECQCGVELKAPADIRNCQCWEQILLPLPNATSPK